MSTTTRMGANLGHHAAVAGDACDCLAQTAPDGCFIDAKAMHAAHLATLSAEFAEVLTTAELIAA